MKSTAIIDAVVIGRNEGDRLITCLRSLNNGQVRQIVYVDSGSTDGSVSKARELGALVVELDLSLPFTAARARNAGLAQLPPGDYVQMVDGDCTVDPGWITVAVAQLDTNATTAIVCGRRREQHPQASVYNRLCDREWDTPIGDTLTCGGDALMRRDALDQLGGYRDDLIAGEEPELCVRLRHAGWSIQRLDAEMTSHDARIMRFSQWWQRSRRAGYAFAEGAALHGKPPERHWVRETRRALVWGLGLPLAVLMLGLLNPLGWALLLLYPVQVLRLISHMGPEAAFFTTLGKFPEAQGAIEYLWHRGRSGKRGLIEYK